MQHLGTTEHPLALQWPAQPLRLLLHVQGAANTYMRTGKLFPGPHLYFGAIICALWAAAAALVPLMQVHLQHCSCSHHTTALLPA